MEPAMKGQQISSPPKITTLLQKFFLFPKLPTELRDKIWSFASRVPRVIEPHYNSELNRFFTFEPIPSVLHVNSESRAIGLTNYCLSFETAEAPATIYFNSNIDTITLNSRQSLKEIKAFLKRGSTLNTRNQIQTLALDAYLWRRVDEYSLGPITGPGPFLRKKGPWSIPDFHRLFPGLRKLIFVNGPFQVISMDANQAISTNLSLVESSFNEELVEDENLAVGAVISYFEGRKLKNPDVLYPEIIAMDYQSP